ncbi:MAG TPA: FtsX-like permease family protein, partial [Lentibacillus sp.]
TQLSVYVIRRLKGSKGIFWRKTNMVLFSDLSFRMKDNARTFFMVAIISTVAFSAIGSLYGFQSYLTKEVKEMNPYTFTYSPFEADESQMQKQSETVDETLNKYDIQTEKASVELNYFEVDNSERPQVLIAKESDYNRFAGLLGEEKVDVGDQGAIVVADSSKVMIGASKKERLMDVPIEMEDGGSIHPDRLISTVVLPEMYAYYIVDDDTFESLPKPVESKTYITWQATQGSQESIIEAGRILQNKFQPGVFQAIDYTIYTINKGYGPVLFIGLFIGVVFFVSAGSFLYFRLYSDLDQDKIKFKAIAKMGLTDKELKKVINRQTALLFFAPIVVALIHGAVALTALSHLFDYNLAGESTMVLGSFALIQIIYFLVVRYFYTKQIRSAVFP